ncbi:MAG: hypothetical protein GY753_14975 [Gammaproteobacteria bacterium]|nr:hypothetical protein [Gammaproteobacteria bacterium]
MNEKGNGKMMRRSQTEFATNFLTVLISNHLPKLGTNLVTALAGLDVDNLSHF